MRVLLDENVPRKLKYRLAPEHEVLTVPEQGWSGLLNGELLRVADAEFEAFVTLDRGLEYQQVLGGLSIRVGGSVYLPRSTAALSCAGERPLVMCLSQEQMKYQCD